MRRSSEPMPPAPRFDSPPPPPAEFGSGQGQFNKPEKKGGRRILWFFIGVIVSPILLIGGCVALLAAGGSGTDGVDQQGLVVSPTTVAVGNSETTQSPAGDEADAPDTTFAPAVVVGTRDQPLAFDQLAGVRWDVFGDADGSIWNTKIGPISNATAAVLEENSFNDAPEEGMIFAAFDVEMTLAQADKVPLAPAFNMTFEVIGGSSAVAHDGYCGVIPNDFENFKEVYRGGTITGTACVAIAEADLNDPNTTVALNFGGERVYFGAEGIAGGVAEIGADTPTSKDQEEAGRFNPVPYDTPVSLKWDVLGDADGSVWKTVVGKGTDITGAVLSENSFNGTPPDGWAYIGFPVEMTLESASKEPLSVFFNAGFELTGGSSFTAQTGPCGVVPGEFDVLSEVFAGGTVSGTICVLAPLADLDHPNSRFTIKFGSDNRAHFAN